MKKFGLHRLQHLADGIFGMLRDESGQTACYTLEHAFALGALFVAAMAAGTYTCVRYRSPKHGYDVFLVQDVQGHTFIELHIGCFNRDSDGCVLLGNSIKTDATGTQMLFQSAAAFKRFMKLLEGESSFQLTVYE